MLSVLILWVVISSLAGSIPAAAQQTYAVSLVGIELEAGEEIIGFRIEMTGTSLQSLRWRHNNWSVSSVTMNASAQSMGQTADPAAAVMPDAFHEFLIIGTAPDPASKLRLHGELVVRDVGKKDAQERYLTLTMHQFKLRQIQ